MAVSENPPPKISRQEALHLGLARFFDGRPCHRGHIAEKFTSSTNCVECRGTGPARTLARKEAIKNGDLTYRGSVCQKDPTHGDLRYTSGGWCMSCAAIKSAAAYDPKRHPRELLPPEEARRRKLKRQKDWREANAERVTAYDNEYKAKKYQEDINYKLIMALRNRLNRAVQRNSKAGSAVRDLGCTIDEFREHIASQFQPGMTWENWGVGAGKWHLDHIKPLAELNMRLREDFLIGAHWSNYRPLWSEENSGRRTNLGRGKFGKSKAPEGAML